MRIVSKSAQVTYRIAFTRDEIEALCECSDHHYDAVCREVARTGWLRNAIQAAHWVKTKSTNYEVALDWRELDILSKIMEVQVSPTANRTALAVWGTFADLRKDAAALQAVLDQEAQ